MSTSLPPHAKLNSIINDLFQNEIIKSDGMKEYYTFSDLYLTEDQQKTLVYPSGFVPMNLFILQQVDSHIGNNYTVRQSFVSFVKNGDGYIYGYYFDIHNNPAFDIDVLSKSKHSVKLSTDATFESIDLLEVYNNVFGKTIILSLGNKVPYATIQYSHCNRYYYEVLTSTGIQDPQAPVTKLLELSRNLSKYLEHCS
jgi:hypothetical protein